jgi:ABC-type glycerol-3-phosphate transport system permease component
MNRRRTMSLFWQRRARRFVLPIGGLVITGLLLLPIYFTIESSLAPSSSFQALSQSLAPSHFVFSNYRLAFDQERGSIVTSLLRALHLTGVAYGGGSPSGRDALPEVRWRVPGLVLD